MRYLLVLVIIPWSVRVAGQNIHHSELTFTIDQFSLVASGDGHFMVDTDEAGYFYPDNPRLPALPVRTLNIVVPNGAVLADYSFSTEELIVGEDISIANAPAPLPTTIREADRDIQPGRVNSEPDPPGRTVEYRATLVQRGYTWFSFAISPFKYDRETRILTLAGNIVLEVEYRVDGNRASSIHPHGAISQHIRGGMVNPGDLEKFYPVHDHSLLKSAAGRVDYLIVTTEEFKPEFQPLLEWKIRKGLRSEIITLEEIISEYKDSTIQLKIKRCLYDYYTNHDLQWVLLGGDNNVVPVQRCYTRIYMGGTELIDESVPTDLFYGCFDQRFDWNSTVDDKIGEAYKDGHDLVPEIFISRAPVRDHYQVRTFVRKTLAYEMNFPRNDFAEKMLLAGVKSWTSWEGKSDNHHRSETMFKKQVADKWKGKKTNFFDTGTDFSEGPGYQVTSPNLSAQLNNGYGIFHFAGHGNIRSLMMESGTPFKTEDALSLTNHAAGIMLATSCDVNAFDSIDPCLSEAFLRNPDGGCVAFFGSSRYGFGNPGQTSLLGPSFQYNATFLKHLFKPSSGVRGNSFATIAAMAKTDFTHNGSSGGIYLYLLYALNAMGDPELPVFTSDPATFGNVRIYRMGNALTVNTGGTKNCRICLTSDDLAEGYHQTVENVSFHTFEDIPDAFQVTITGPNFTPYRYRSGFSTGIEDNLNSCVRIYPNPVSDILQMDIDFPNGRMMVYDIQGRFLLEQEVFHGTNRISLSDYPDGTYLLKFQSDRGTGWFKVLKQPSY